MMVYVVLYVLIGVAVATACVVSRQRVDEDDLVTIGILWPIVCVWWILVLLFRVIPEWISEKLNDKSR